MPKHGDDVASLLPFQSTCCSEPELAGLLHMLTPKTALKGDVLTEALQTQGGVAL